MRSEPRADDIHDAGRASCLNLASILASCAPAADLPQPGQPVVLLLSGGLDSAVTLAWLVEEQAARVYPLFVRRGQRAQHEEERAARAVHRAVRRRARGDLEDLCVLSVSNPPRPLRPAFAGRPAGIPMREAILAATGVQYAASLAPDPVRTVLFAEPYEASGPAYPHTSTVAFRTQTLLARVHMADGSWTVASPFNDVVERRKTKADLIRWAHAAGLSLRPTVSCYQLVDGAQCGFCRSCVRRREAFAEAGLKDDGLRSTIEGHDVSTCAG